MKTRTNVHSWMTFIPWPTNNPSHGRNRFAQEKHHARLDNRGLTGKMQRATFEGFHPSPSIPKLFFSLTSMRIIYPLPRPMK